jgi:hypothetical protein
MRMPPSMMRYGFRLPIVQKGLTREGKVRRCLHELATRW